MGKPTQATIDARVNQLIAAFDDYLAFGAGVKWA
jgi:hypothetical protein